MNILDPPVKANTAGLHILTLSALTGMTFYVSCVAFLGVAFLGFIDRVRGGFVSGFTTNHFPQYFGLGTGMSAVLCCTWMRLRPDILPTLVRGPWKTDTWQLAALIAAMGCMAVNWGVLRPLTTSLMFTRHKFEKSTDANAYGLDQSKLSPEMRKLNRQFAVVHSVSTITNLAVFGVAIWHSLWLGTALSYVMWWM
ncbi:hypothetical protein BC937DRAFT_90907 [Endogone sp. FLAS-F59071]|nr:hypothetical protein BC937DRAFT_90907 [Endogone sp. FLAS-F59071]|eukprot:RUS21952.1 hypothetical protein BC937DRAFT_90907 [Endogone sp. FLAS-F59071]